MEQHKKIDFGTALKGFTSSFSSVIKELKQQQKKMLITTHRYLDGDAFGSAVAFGLILRKLDIDSTLLCVPFVPEKFQFLKNMSGLHILDFEAMGLRKIEDRKYDTEVFADFFSKEINGYGALTILDCAGYEQIPEEVWSVSGCLPYRINIDHHVGYKLDLSEDRTLNLVGEFSSTSEILFRVTKALGVSIDPEISVPLYIGINADLRKNDISQDSPNYPKKILRKLNNQIQKVGEETRNRIKSIFSLDAWEKQLLKMITDSIQSSDNIAYSRFDSHTIFKAKEATDSLHILRMPFHEFHVRLRQHLKRYRKEFELVVIFDQILGKVSLYNLAEQKRYDLARISKELGDGGGHWNRAGFSFQTAKDNLIKANDITAGMSEEIIMEKMVKFIRRKLSEIDNATGLTSI
ncbi:bifunctional oligoribonuclease/PAP phosphatase NrnA [Thermodesulfobacteriota bacterium]